MKTQKLSLPSSPSVTIINPSHLQVSLAGSGLAGRSGLLLACPSFLSRCLLSERCPLIRACRACSVSPTYMYCSPHFLHEITYIRFLDRHGISVLMLYFLPVLLLVKKMQVTNSTHHLQRLLLHRALPVLVVGAGWSGDSSSNQ